MAQDSHYIKAYREVFAEENLEVSEAVETYGKYNPKIYYVMERNELWNCADQLYRLPVCYKTPRHWICPGCKEKGFAQVVNEYHVEKMVHSCKQIWHRVDSATYKAIKYRNQTHRFDVTKILRSWEDNTRNYIIRDRYAEAIEN